MIGAGFPSFSDGVLSDEDGHCPHMRRFPWGIRSPPPAFKVAILPRGARLRARVEETSSTHDPTHVVRDNTVRSQ